MFTCILSCSRVRDRLSEDVCLYSLFYVCSLVGHRVHDVYFCSLVRVQHFQHCGYVLLPTTLWYSLLPIPLVPIPADTDCTFSRVTAASSSTSCMLFLALLNAARHPIHNLCLATDFTDEADYLYIYIEREGVECSGNYERSILALISDTVEYNVNGIITCSDGKLHNFF